MLAYHVTKRENIEFIATHGLVSGLLDYKNYDTTGEGIYVFFDKASAANIAENIAIDDPVLITTEVDISDLLMDEDALYDDTQGDFVEMLARLIPRKGIKEWRDYIKSHDGQDEFPIDDPEVAEFKIGFIDKY